MNRELPKEVKRMLLTVTCMGLIIFILPYLLWLVYEHFYDALFNTHPQNNQ